MWLAGFPTGLLLIALSPLLPESARFLIEKGRVAEAREMLARYSVVVSTGSLSASNSVATNAGLERSQVANGLNYRPLFGMGTALTLAALAWGFVNFGVLLWLPASMIAEGRSIGLTSALIAKSTLIAIPTIAVATYLYTVWSTKRVLMLAIGITAMGLVATLVRDSSAVPFLSNPLLSVSLLIVGTSAVISTLMPYAAESFPIRLRGRATGWVAGCSKVGGVMAQGMAALALVPAFGLTAGGIAVPAVASLLLVAIFGHETRGRDLRELEAIPSIMQETVGDD
jgi:putative MFS transporter